VKNKIIDVITKIGEDMYNSLAAGAVYEITTPSRSVKNLVFDEASGTYILGDKTTRRSIKKVSELKTILRMAMVLRYIRDELISKNDIATLRELYYLFKNVDVGGIEIGFGDQGESNLLVEDIEWIMRKHIPGVTREVFHIVPEDSGAACFGPLKMYDPVEKATIDYSTTSDGVSIPLDPYRPTIKSCEARFILAIETAGMYKRVALAVKSGKAKELAELKPLLISTKGMPSRAVRLFMKRLNAELGLPILLFTDYDFGGARIYIVCRYGAAKTAYLELANEKIIWVNRMSDIEEYKLPSEPMSEKRLNDLKKLLNDPRVKNTQAGEEIRKLIEIRREAEQQAFAASKDLYYVTNKFLPRRLKELLGAMQ